MGLHWLPSPLDMNWVLAMKDSMLWFYYQVQNRSCFRSGLTGISDSGSPKAQYCQQPACCRLVQAAKTSSSAPSTVHGTNSRSEDFTLNRMVRKLQFEENILFFVNVNITIPHELKIQITKSVPAVDCSYEAALIKHNPTNSDAFWKHYSTGNPVSGRIGMIFLFLSHPRFVPLSLEIQRIRKSAVEIINESFDSSFAADSGGSCGYSAWRVIQRRNRLPVWVSMFEFYPDLFIQRVRSAWKLAVGQWRPQWPYCPFLMFAWFR